MPFSLLTLATTIGCSKWLTPRLMIGILNMTNSVAISAVWLEMRFLGIHRGRFKQAAKDKAYQCMYPQGFAMKHFPIIFHPGYFGYFVTSLWQVCHCHACYAGHAYHLYKLLIDFICRVMRWLYQRGDVRFSLARLAHFLPADRSLFKPQSRELRSALKVGILSWDCCMILKDWGSKDDKDAELYRGVFELWAQQSRAFYEHMMSDL